MKRLEKKTPEYPGIVLRDYLKKTQAEHEKFRVIKIAVVILFAIMMIVMSMVLR